MAAKAVGKGNVASRVWELAEPLARELGLSLWDVQYQKEGSDFFLRILIDREGGVSIDDCVDMTHALSPVLDAEDPISQEYMLEVSSPGYERKLTRPEHFKFFEGEEVRVKLLRPAQDGERELTGTLGELSAGGDFSLTLQDGGERILNRRDCSSVWSIPPEIDFDEIEDEPI